jgi:hypothetical protein
LAKKYQIGEGSEKPFSHLEQVDFDMFGVIRMVFLLAPFDWSF